MDGLGQPVSLRKLRLTARPIHVLRPTIEDRSSALRRQSRGTHL